MCGDSWLPTPDIADILARRPVPKIKPLDLVADSAAVFIISSLHNVEKCRGLNGPEDTVALRMWSFLEASDELCAPGMYGSLIDAHREDMRKVAIAKSLKKTKARLVMATGHQDPELMEQTDQLLQRGEPLPVPLPVVDDVLMFIKNKGCDRGETTEGMILAMCDRGLCVHASGEYLTCRHHPGKKFLDTWALWTAKAHLKTFGYHDKEETQMPLKDESNAKTDAPVIPLQLGTTMLRR